MTKDLIKVLIVGDDPDTSTKLSEILKLDGHQVDVASCGKEAIIRLQQQHYTIAVTDWHLSDGDVDGFLPAWLLLAPDCSFVIVTANSDLDAAIAALKDSAADYLTKPINGELLRTRVSNILKNRAAEKVVADAQRLASIGQMMAGIAHESRNGLQRIQAGIDTLKLDFLDLPQTVMTSESLGTIAQIEMAAEGIERLLNEVREYAAPIQLETAATDLREIWRAAWRSVSSVHNTCEVFFEELQMPPHDAREEDCLMVNADAFRMEQVFRNLFENSIAACRQTPRIQIASRRVAGSDGDYLQVSVRDNGQGIPASEVDRVFEPFFTTKPRGTGLGIPIVKRIVEAHGGAIRIERNQQPGTEIVLTFPLLTDTCSSGTRDVAASQTSFTQLNATLNFRETQNLDTVMQ